MSIAYHTAHAEDQSFSLAELEIIVEMLFHRVSLARGPMSVYFDVTGEFRASPAHGSRSKRAFMDFPDCIIGVYTPKVDWPQFREDVFWFCKKMGLEEQEENIC